jgi:ribonucleotide monophosphatase NagD (HAD superfamily)
MLGDDLESDITGAKNNGAETILIFTGKTEKTYPKNYVDKVDFEANNLKEVITMLEKLY